MSSSSPLRKDLVSTKIATFISIFSLFSASDLFGLRINEIMASNSSTTVPNAVAGRFNDWIEIFNEEGSAVSLSGWHLTDDLGLPIKWTFPANTTIPANGYLIVFASGDDAPDSNGNLHTNFTLRASGDSIALVRPDLTIASSYLANGNDFPNQFTDVSYGVSPTDGSLIHFNNPTPGAVNDPAEFLFVEDTNFSHRRGYYTSPIEVTISSDTPGTTIRFTRDGSEPTLTTNGFTYTTPIPISQTTVIRAIAFKAGYAPTNIDTQSYIFPNSVVTQTRPPGYPTSWGDEPNADYDVDPDIAQSPTYSQRFLEGLRELPTLSVTSDRDLIFGPQGIYSNTMNETLEVPCSAEYFQPNATSDEVNDLEGFQVDCGIRIQGGSSRIPDRAIKHSMSLRFREQYGPGKLDFPLFAGAPVESFDSVHLRAMYNNSWIHGSTQQQQRATMIRDQWARDTMIAMGNADGGHGSYCHLYLNGIYWGVYNLHERLENDHYATYNNFDSDEVIGINPMDGTSPLNPLRSAINSGDWDAVTQMMDIDNYIDYYLAQHFVLNDDLSTTGNWRVAGGGTANAPWRFYCWDTERSLENLNDTGPLAKSQDGAEIINGLDNFLEFRVRFADRAQKHLNNGGALTPAACRARWQQYSDLLDIAIVCESARWADDRRPNDPYTRDDDWLPAVNNVINNFFRNNPPNRTSIFTNALRTQSWPGVNVPRLLSTAAPQFQVNNSLQHGGTINLSDQISFSSASGRIYYTLDGSDPRDNGSIAANAILFNGEPITLSESSTINARVRNPNGSWSPISSAIFLTEIEADSELVISELMYHPVGPNSEEFTAGQQLPTPRILSEDDFEFIELLNTGSIAINLQGVTFTSGIAYTFENTSLQANERLILARDPEAFAIRYGSISAQVIGGYVGTLSNGGELITTTSATGNIIQSFEYDDRGAWPGRADGIGSSLELEDPSATASGAEDANDASSWDPSCDYLGSPGTAGTLLPPMVVVNEVLSSSIAPAVDAIELYNPTTSAIDISNWFLSDSRTMLQRYQIPSNTIIPAGGYLVFDESDFNSSGTIADFALSSTNGDDVYLIQAEPDGTLLKFIDDVEFGAAAPGVPLARVPNGTGPLVPTVNLTLGTSNSTPLFGPVLVTEIMYHHPSNDPNLEFIEICNNGMATENLANWTLRGGVDFNFNTTHQLAPGEVLVLVGFDPTDTGLDAAFRNAYNISSSVTLVGPWTDGNLSNGGDDFRIQRAGSPPADDPSLFPQYIEDYIEYDDDAPWPLTPDGSGDSLNRFAATEFGIFNTSWLAQTPTPGDKNLASDYESWAQIFFNDPASSSPAADPDDDGFSNLLEYTFGGNPLINDSSSIIPLEMQINGSTIELTFQTNLSRSDVTLILESSSDLITWETVPSTTLDTAGFIETRGANLPFNSAEKEFFRIQVSQ